MLERFYIKSSDVKDVLSFYPNQNSKVLVLFVNRPCDFKSENKNIRCISMSNTEIRSVLAGRDYTDLIVYGYDDLDTFEKSFVLSRFRSMTEYTFRLYLVKD